jgi:hypothetical protein
VEKGYRSDEIEQLADAFNHMTASIRVSREQLKEIGAEIPLSFRQRPQPGFCGGVGTGSKFWMPIRRRRKPTVYIGELIGRPFDESGNL